MRLFRTTNPAPNVSPLASGAGQARFVFKLEGING